MSERARHSRDTPEKAADPGRPGQRETASGSPSTSGVFGAVDATPQVEAAVTLGPAQLSLLTQLAKSRSSEAAEQLGRTLLESLSDDDEALRRLVGALSERARAFEHQRRLAGRDELTGVANRRSFNEALRREVSRARRSGRHLSLLMLDVDGLKRINDNGGHAAGDLAIQAVANACVESVRDTDQVARLGGDEFAVLLPDADDEEAASVGERVRRRLSEHPVGTGTLEVSVGHAHLRPAQDEQSLLERADRALYRNKRARSARTQS